MIRVRTPFARDKNLANAYNSEFENCPDGDWLCLIDHDVVFLTPDAIEIMYQYIEKFPDAGLFTCYTNRIHPLSSMQNFLGAPSNDFDIKNWAYRARIQAMNDATVTELEHPISGFLMLISKSTWNVIKFRGSGCLGVDNNFSDDVLKSGRKIYRMDRVVVWHSYRMENIQDKKHLR
jgi:GT2 family glycosyltransferase